MRRLIGLLVLVPALLAAAPAAAQQLDPPEVPDVEVPDVEVPDLPGPDLPGAPDGVLPGDDEDGNGPETQALDEGPFGHACEPIDGEAGILVCPTDTLDDRVPTFDGAPLDVDVTLPPGFDPAEPEAAPTIVIMHGYGGNKKDFESESEEGRRAEDDRDFHYNNVHFARKGYVVVNYTARGFGRSCGPQERSNETEACRDTRSYIHLADQRWEVRDTQFLLGLLADQKFTEPKKIGVTGISYGGGQSIMLAFLRDHIRLGALADEEQGGLAPWKSPDGKDMEIAAAFPRWPWSDLVASLLPNGRFLEDEISGDRESRDPIGVALASYVVGLFASGAQAGTYCGSPPRGLAPPDPEDDPKYNDPEPGPAPDQNPLCVDLSADLTQANVEVLQGEPYEGDDVVEAITDDLFEFHSGYALAEREPSPLLLQSGWTDDLFPPRESLRVYDKVRKDHQDVPVSLQLGDIGHPRASNKEQTDQDFNDEGTDFFAKHLQGENGGPEPGSARAWTQTCPVDAAPEGPFTRDSFDLLHPNTRAFGSPAPQTVESSVFNPNSAQYDPVGDAMMQNPCEGSVDERPPGSDEDGGIPGTAAYRGPRSDGFRMLGLPTVTARLTTTGNGPSTGLTGQLDSRLWDVAPDGSQILVSRGAYRLTENQSGREAFQLSGNGWCFEAGHRPKLELVGQDPPYLRPSTPVITATTVRVSELEVKLPGTQERCGAGADAGAPAPGGGGGGSSGDDDGSGNGNGRSGGSNGGGADDSEAAPIPPAPPSPVACLLARAGSPRADRVFGTAGGDSIQGLGGADRLFGLAGDDCLFGGPGNDRLSGGPGNDRLSGAAGNDVLRGGPGTNAYSGGPGNDRLYTRDGAAQRVFCGSGRRDSAWIDARDTPRGCERVRRPRR